MNCLTLDRPKIIASIAAACCPLFLPLYGVASAQCPQSSTDSLAIIRCRYLEETIPTDVQILGEIKKSAGTLAASQRQDGTWPDIDYDSSERSEWRAAKHLDRVLTISKAAYARRQSGRPDPRLEEAGLAGMRFWLAKDLTNLNWWWNQIGVPELLGETALLLQPKMSRDDFNRLLPILKRSDWTRWTGANLIWGVANQIVRGVLYGDASAVNDGYARLYEEIQTVPGVLPDGSPGEGIQTDRSFHQHGAQFYSGGYGLDYAMFAARFITYTWGTPLQIPADKMQTFASFLLDGQQWMIRGEIFDYAAVGREITRKDEAVVQHDWTRGPVSGYDGAYTLANAMNYLVRQPIPRQSELRAFAKRLSGRAKVPQLTGNRMFWDSDYMSHRREGYATSVKMLSARIQNSEIVNSEGRWSTHLSDGMNLLYRTGEEYRGIFAAWDWALVPGTTAVHAYRSDGTPDTGEKELINVRGNSPFVGGASDGNYGIAAMDLRRGTLSARKAWFFYDHFYVALGSGISAEDAGAFVATDINQTKLNGSVVTNISQGDHAGDKYSYKPGALRYVHHDGTGYVLGPGLRATLSAGIQSGRWSDFGTGPDTLVQTPVFNLWIDHGFAPRDATYQYSVMPGATVAETAAESAHPSMVVLANSEDAQAVFVPKLRMVSLAIRKALSIATPIGNVALDQPAIVMVREDATGYTVTAANPTNKTMNLRVKIGGQEVVLNLPDGDMAGSSVSLHLDGREPNSKERKQGVSR